MKIAIVDDNPIDIAVLTNALKGSYEIFSAQNGLEAIKLIKEQLPDLVLLDILIPDMDGLDLCRLIRADESLGDTIIIFVTANNSPAAEAQGLGMGSVDYITKPINIELVKLRVRNQLELKQQRSVIKEQSALLTLQNAELKKSIARSTSAELVAEESSRYAESIVEAVREPLLVLDTDLKIISANHNFYRTFQVAPGDTIGSFIYNLGNKQWNIPKLREMLEETLPKEEAFDDFEVSHDFQDIGHKIMLLNARIIYREDIGSKMILLAIEDITERKRVERALEEEHRQLQRAVDEIRTLRGIIPICSYCKQIRNDDGFWSQVEQYVSDHTEAKFSHGICPACFEREMKGIKGET